MDRDDPTTNIPEEALSGSALNDSRSNSGLDDTSSGALGGGALDDTTSASVGSAAMGGTSGGAGVQDAGDAMSGASMGGSVAGGGVGGSTMDNAGTTATPTRSAARDMATDHGHTPNTTGDEGT